MKTLFPKILALARNRDGNAMLEFAIGAGVLVSVFSGTFQFGFTFLQYNNLQNAAARGARYASVIPYDSDSATPSSSYEAAVKNMVLYGSPTVTTQAVSAGVAAPAPSPALPGLTTNNINVAVFFSNGVPSNVTVSITGYAINSVFATTTLVNKPAVTYAYQGIWSPI